MPTSFEETMGGIKLPIDMNTRAVPPLAGFNSATSAVVPIGVELLADGTYGIKLGSLPAIATATVITPVTVTETATAILALSAARRGHVLFNAGSQTLYVGTANTVTTATGIPIAAGASFSLDLNSALYTGAVYGITAAGLTTSVRGVTYA